MRGNGKSELAISVRVRSDCYLVRTRAIDHRVVVDLPPHGDNRSRDGLPRIRIHHSSSTRTGKVQPTERRVPRQNEAQRNREKYYRDGKKKPKSSSPCRASLRPHGSALAVVFFLVHKDPPDVPGSHSGLSIQPAPCVVSLFRRVSATTVARNPSKLCRRVGPGATRGDCHSF